MSTILISRVMFRFDSLPTNQQKENMPEERRDSRRSGSVDRPRKPERTTVNIRFARGLSYDQLNTILQLELLRARSQSPPAKEVSLPTELIHDIKYRLRYYSENCGEVPRTDDRRDSDYSESGGYFEEKPR
jgi:hypothetical protein